MRHQTYICMVNMMPQAAASQLSSLPFSLQRKVITRFGLWLGLGLGLGLQESPGPSLFDVDNVRPGTYLERCQAGTGHKLFFSTSGFYAELIDNLVTGNQIRLILLSYLYGKYDATVSLVQILEIRENCSPMDTISLVVHSKQKVRCKKDTVWFYGDSSQTFS